MLLTKGMVVRSKKGHDKGSFYVVYYTAGSTAYLINGENRTPSAPKKKNALHLAPTKTALSEAQLGSDGEIRRILAVFGGRAALPKEVK